jgi:hypothetical protein
VALKGCSRLEAYGQGYCPHAQSLSRLTYSTHEIETAIPAHPAHFCTLLPQFPKLRKLDWALRVTLDTNPCEIEGLSGWSYDLTQVLLRHRREWHGRHKAAMGTLDWNVKIHMSRSKRRGCTLFSNFQPPAHLATAV